MGEFSDSWLSDRESSALQMDVLDFRYVIPYRNQSTSNATGIENWGQFSHFLTLIIKI